MPRLLVESLPYRRDSARVFAEIAAEPWSMLLDSGAGGVGGGRFDILVALPRMTLTSIGLVTEVRSTDGLARSGADPLDLVRMVAVARIMMPKARVRLSAGRKELTREAQLLCMYAGANSIFYGDRLLTTDNPEEDSDSALLEAAGLHGQAPSL